MVAKFDSRAKWLILLAFPLFAFSGYAKDRTTTIIEGEARFQFLTPSLVRMEYSPSGTFVNAPTAVIKKRDWPAVSLVSKKEDGWLTVRTSEMTLRYRLGSGKFEAGSLEVTWRDSTGFHSWHRGEVDSLNLGGLTYSLDNVSKSTLLSTGNGRLVSPVNDTVPGINVILRAAQPGLLSLGGYAFINDSRTPVWNARDEWIEPRKDTSNQDWYLFVYGRNYRKVLNEYAELSGHIPMIPRYTLGPWITDMNFEYFPDSYQSEQPVFKKYNEHHLKNEILKFRENGIPLDILVLDFGWHNYGWQGGFDWSPLIPYPREFLNWLHASGIKVSLNDHPGYANTRMSILSYKDSHAPQVLKDLERPLPKKATFNMDISMGWRFSPDPRDEGMKLRWPFGNFNDKSWKPIEIGIPLQNQGYENYGGIGWYFKEVDLPLRLPDSLFLYLGEVTGSYTLFVNGREVPHTVARWPRRLTYADVGPYVKAGQENKILIRVRDEEDGGGITARPVALENATPPPRIHFDLSNKKQAEVFMADLHKPLMQEGVNFWWVDGGSGDVEMPGLNEQMWTNRVYYDYTQEETNKRGFIFGRYGGWGSQRYPAYFTGDTYSHWAVLAYEVPFTASGGNVLVPYITNDIGGFHGPKISFNLYARWIEFGTFSPILRLHSAHENPYEGNLRMPWTYGKRGTSLVKKYFTLRTKLIPYIYTYTRLAHEESMPILRPLYLEYPYLKEAYKHPHEYFFGSEMLVAPVVDSTGNRTVYLPPGNWVDFFTGKKYNGGRTFTAHYATDETPVFVREGGIIPEQHDMAYSDEKPLDSLIINIYGSGNGSFDLYEDDGVSLKYKDGEYAWTPLTYSTNEDGTHRVVIGPTKRSFGGQTQSRSYELQVHGVSKPRSVSVNGDEAMNWKWNGGESIVIIKLPLQNIRDKITVDLNR